MTRLYALWPVLVLLGGCDSGGYDPFGDAFDVADADNDGFLDDEDCEPNDVLSNPDSVEVCDLIDNDCDGEIDEDPVVGDTWYPDLDGDNYGVYEEGVIACERPEGHSANPGDCDDDDELSYPNADEICDGADNDCDDYIDEAAVDLVRWYIDSDGDGFGWQYDSSFASCPDPDGNPPAGYADNNEDCDDDRDDISPTSPEVCDDENRDEDCDGLSDDADSSTIDQTTYYYDADGDGYGDDDILLYSCEPQHYPLIGGDCDTSDSSINPGAQDPPGDGVDSDCDGSD
jgi:hypothetical protein